MDKRLAQTHIQPPVNDVSDWRSADPDHFPTHFNRALVQATQHK